MGILRGYFYGCFISVGKQLKGRNNWKLMTTPENSKKIVILP
jgi:hypothetical protein